MSNREQAVDSLWIQRRLLYLGNTILSRADLSDTDLSGADLSHADLSGARGVTTEQLAACKCLKGATIPGGQVLESDDHPDGPTLEEWLKSHGRENSGP
jgi:hypothetical protein